MNKKRKIEKLVNSLLGEKAKYWNVSMNEDSLRIDDMYFAESDEDTEEFNFNKCVEEYESELKENLKLRVNEDHSLQVGGFAIPFYQVFVRLLTLSDKRIFLTDEENVMMSYLNCKIDEELKRLK